MNERLILCGAGNLAWHLGAALQKAGQEIIQVWNRNEARGRELAAALRTPWSGSADKLDPDATMILLCISDDAISGLALALDRAYAGHSPDTMLVHTAGAVDLHALDPPGPGARIGHTGVLYPLMTFTRNRAVDFETVPICIEASNAEALERLRKLARSLSPEIRQLDSLQRAQLHLAAVIASNFSNHMYHLAEDFLHACDLDFHLLKPVILETTRKAMEIQPAAAQTGPAKRNDRQTLEAHLALLKDHPDPGLANLYTFVSESITRYYHTE